MYAKLLSLFTILSLILSNNSLTVLHGSRSAVVACSSRFSQFKPEKGEVQCVKDCPIGLKSENNICVSIKVQDKLVEVIAKLT